MRRRCGSWSAEKCGFRPMQSVEKARVRRHFGPKSATAMRVGTANPKLGHLEVCVVKRGKEKRGLCRSKYVICRTTCALEENEIKVCNVKERQRWNELGWI